MMTDKRDYTYHIPVLLTETLDFLLTKSDGVYLDCTMGGGGHSREILSRISAKGKLYGVDRDIDAINKNKKLCEKYDNFFVKHIPFSDVIGLDEVTYGLKFDGILLDLGVSSYQIDTAERGFSYMNDGLLDMRMSNKAKNTAAEVVNFYSESDLIRIFRKYGEEKFSKRIAKAIIAKRENAVLKTTLELKDIILGCIPMKNNLKSVSRIFQAIRIEVNEELKELEDFLNFSLDILNPNGRVVIISYHSLEDRIVKQFVNKKAEGCICPKNFPVCVCNHKPELKKVTNKPVMANEDEKETNVRARSAKLRVYQKI